MFSNFISQPLVKFKVFSSRRKASQVNNKGIWSCIQQH